MAVTAQFLKNIMAEARPIIERQMNDAELIAGFRKVVADNGGDWGALKALIKAHIEDEIDEAGDGKRVHKILEKADCTSAYADMLGMANMNEKNFSTGEITEPENQSEQPCTATGPSEEAGASSDETPATHSSVESRERQTTIAVSKPEATPKDRSLPSAGPSGTAAQIFPSDLVSEPAVAKPQDPQPATADQFSRAPVETDPLHEQAEAELRRRRNAKRRRAA